MKKFTVISRVMVELEYEVEAGGEADAEHVVLNDIRAIMDEALHSRWDHASMCLTDSDWNISDIDIEEECEAVGRAGRFARVGGI